MRKFVVIVFFGFLVLLFFAYLAFNFQGFLFGSDIHIEFPQNGQFLSSSHILVEGSAKNITKLEINGRPIYTDENGNFEEKLIMSAGLNIIELKAGGRFGEELRERRMVMVKLPE